MDEVVGKGKCPNCRETVNVVRRGSKLFVAPHRRFVFTSLRRERKVPCPVRGLDAAAAIRKRLDDFRQSMEAHSEAAEKARAQLAQHERVAAKATSEYEEEAAKAEALLGAAVVRGAATAGSSDAPR